jgi:hypothetical protein
VGNLIVAGQNWKEALHGVGRAGTVTATATATVIPY